MNLAKLLMLDFGKNLFLPAHGRGSALPKDIKSLLGRPPGQWDLPELPSIGGPLQKTGQLSISQNKVAELYGADRCWYGVNGATGLLQSALFSLLKPGEAVLIPRNVHRSIINACILGDFRPVLFDLPFLKDRGHFIPPNSLWIERVLDSLSKLNIEISAAVLVNPTYQGYSSDLASVIEKLHNFGLPVLVDEAHGTHFANCIDSGLPKSALNANADLVVNSLHKSCSGLAQTAVLWLRGSRVDLLTLERSLDLYQTSSPSSLLLASCESSLMELSQDAGKQKLKKRIKEARTIFQNLMQNGLPLLQTNDPLRLILHTAPFGISGLEADEWFMARGLVAELPEPGTLTFCLGLAKHYRLDRFITDKWESLLKYFPVGKPLGPFSPPPIPFVVEPELKCRSAWHSSSILVPLEDSMGHISAELICPYPPGIPILIPGERLDHNRVNWLIEQKKLWFNQIPSMLRVVSSI